MEKYGKKFNELDRKQKQEFIWDYYKFHILGAIAVLGILYMVLNHYVLNPPKPTLVDVTITAPYADSKGMEKLQQELVDLVQAKYPEQTASMEVLSFSEQNDPQTEMVMMIKLIAKATNGDLAILILDERNLNYFSTEQALLPLEEYLTDEEIESYRERLVTKTVNGKEVAVAVRLEGESKIRSILPKDYEGYFALAQNVKEKEFVKECLNFLLKENK